MGINVETQNACGCRAMPIAALPTAPGSSRVRTKASQETKYFQEIAAEMIGNQLIIRMEKEKNASLQRKAGQWDPPCDCGIPEIRMPSTSEGPKIMNAGDNNQIVFRIRSRTLVSKDDANYKPETFTYQLGATKKGKDTNDQHRSITVHPYLNDPAGSQLVHSDHITDGNHNIYLLRIKKEDESSGQQKRNIELELRTPKPPAPVRPPLTFSPRKSDALKPTRPEVETKVDKMNGTQQAPKKMKKKK